MFVRINLRALTLNALFLATLSQQLSAGETEGVVRITQKPIAQSANENRVQPVAFEDFVEDVTGLDTDFGIASYSETAEQSLGRGMRPTSRVVNHQVYSHAPASSGAMPAGEMVYSEPMSGYMPASERIRSAGMRMQVRAASWTQDPTAVSNGMMPGVYDGGSAPCGPQGGCPSGFGSHCSSHHSPFYNYMKSKFGYFIPTGNGGQGAGAIGHYHRVYPHDAGYRDQRDSQLWAAQGYGVPAAVPLAPVVGHTYNYSWGLPASRLTPISRPYP